ncbi:HNH endonuclease [Halosolutus halophilus]|uniref:HNH endonuclease n=1 Tax=Halosolutus halophilus TaxID=1552990 RepID=UPI002234EDE9|nr:HNH endonuclease [Halosolutus halophilus]
MTSREWRGDRRAVFERDEYTCRNCGATGGDEEPTTVRTYPVGDVPLEGTVHESSLVTVCSRCFTALQESDALSGLSADRDDLFRLVRDTTRTQGATISDVASFASLVTSLPTALAETDADDDGPRDHASEYVETRQDVLLAIDVVDARLDRLRAVETAELDPEVASPLETVSETATTLQSDLREVVDLGETVVSGLDRCYGCFVPLEESAGNGSGTCGTCGLEPRATDDWHRSEGDGVAFERLFSSINDRLRGTSTTTEALTDRTMALAETLLEE